MADPISVVSAKRLMVRYGPQTVLDDASLNIDEGERIGLVGPNTAAIEWLEDFLAHYQGTCLFVTHDRYFLDKIATGIVELDRGAFLRYTGNYTDFLLARAARQGALDKQERERQKFLQG